jgi:hypothetical protein
VLNVNNTEAARATEGQEAGTNISVTIGGLILELVAGDEIEVYAQQPGGGSPVAQVQMFNLSLVRLGAEFGA